MALSEIIGLFFLVSSCLCPVTLSDLAVLKLDFLPCLSKLTITLNFFFFRFVLVWVWCRSTSLLLEVLDSVVLVCFHHLNRRMSLVVHTDMVQFTGPFYVFSLFWLQDRIFTPVPVIFPALGFVVLALWKMRGSVFGLIIEFQITSKKILTLGHGWDSWIWDGNVILRFLLCADSKHLVCFLIWFLLLKLLIF